MSAHLSSVEVAMLTRLAREAGAGESVEVNWFVPLASPHRCQICAENIASIRIAKTKYGLLFNPGIIQHGRRHLRPYREELKLAEVLAELGWAPAEAIELIFGRQE